MRTKLKHPCVRRIVVEAPDAFRSGHHVEVVTRVTMRCSVRVVAARHQHQIAVAQRHRLVQFTIVGIHTLKRETLWRVDAMVVGFFEVRLMG